MKQDLALDNVRLIYLNFSGTIGDFNREGRRTFNVVIDDPEYATQLSNEGWNVKIKPAKIEGEEPLYHIPVTLKWNDQYPNLNPEIYLKTPNGRVRMLGEDEVYQLDSVKILNVDLDIRPFNYKGGHSITAYLSRMEVTHEVNRFAARYQD